MRAGRRVAGLCPTIVGRMHVTRRGAAPSAGRAGPSAGRAGPSAGRAGPSAGCAGPSAGRAGPSAGCAGPIPGRPGRRESDASHSEPRRLPRTTRREPSRYRPRSRSISGESYTLRYISPWRESEI
ncbi:hypothetical protein DJ81_17880 [Halorubrum sp. Hd13]|nr:hypothetical protein DJ81_17880 [Halorubrum sp. Hd13]